MQDRHPLFRTASPETVLITAICLLDLMTTLYWVAQGQAREGNPFMAYFLDRGHVPFILVKILTFLPALIIAECYRPRNPELIARVKRWVIAGYVAIYVAGVYAHEGRVIDFYRHLLFG